MAVTIEKMSIIVCMFGGVSFFLGIIGEFVGRKCIHSSDLIVALGYGSLAFLLASTLVGYISIYPVHNGTFIVPSSLFEFTALIMFYLLAWCCTVVATVSTLWATLKEQYHWNYSTVYGVNAPAPTSSANPEYCNTAKTNFMGDGAFMSLISSCLWLFCIMLTKNARDDYLRQAPPRV